MTALAENEDDDLIPLSALQHQLFCPRQCALIHIERVWAENRFTAEGRVLHERADKQGGEKRKGVRVLTALPIRSLRLGVYGVADVVELHENGKKPFPVEYKRGKPKKHRADEVQLCAQAMALEEMFAVELSEGALFYGETRRRLAVSLDQELRLLTADIAASVRNMIAAGKTPAPVYEPRRCDACSLIELCKPKQFEQPRNVQQWLSRAINAEAEVKTRD